MDDLGAGFVTGNDGFGGNTPVRAGSSNSSSSEESEMEDVSR